jgi:hypothetical protein
VVHGTRRFQTPTLNQVNFNDNFGISIKRVIRVIQVLM